MLKACWDCISGTTREQADNEIIYHTPLNGDTQKAPQWPEQLHENEIMFVLPRKLNLGDKINIAGILRSNPQMMSINLMSGNVSPDYQNIACQFEARFPNNQSNENRIVIKVIHNGSEDIMKGNYEENTATDYFTDTNFTFGFSIRLNSNYEGIPILDVYVDGSYIHQIQLKHSLNDIRFLMLNGDIEKVEKLDFQFS